MPLNARPFLRAARLQSIARQPQISRRACLSTSGKLSGGTPGEASEQAAPIGPYYEAILIKPQPVPDVKPEEPPTSSPKSPRTTVKKSPDKKPQDPAGKRAASQPSSSLSSSPPTSVEPSSSPEPSAPPTSAQEKARIIFGSRLAGPAERAERLNAIRKRSTLIAGILVPPRPDEPDNCCMSGCVNCVWDRYRDEMEEWVAASAEADKALQAQRSRGPVDVLGGASAVKDMSDVQRTGAPSMGEDGGAGSETHWEADLKKADRPKIAKDLWDDDLYKNVPVGIREFMKQEKKLKEKHDREGTFGA